MKCLHLLHAILIASLTTILFTSWLSNTLLQTPSTPQFPSDDGIDFRVIAMSYKRASSLLILLNSLNHLELDGDRAVLDIWIDRDPVTNDIDARTLSAARSFKWTGGVTQVHVHEKSVGIYGQWFNTWKPSGNRELALFLEDDLVVSPYAYRWLRAVHSHYGNYTDFAGASLTSSDDMLTMDRKRRIFYGPKTDSVFMYVYSGSWGFSPDQRRWAAFQEWYNSHKISVRPDFKPYVPRTIMTDWYRTFETKGTQDTMWTMWFLYYMRAEQIFAVFNNLVEFTGNFNTCLCVHRAEIGLHYSRKGKESVHRLLKFWKQDFVTFPLKIARIDFDGRIRSYRWAVQNEWKIMYKTNM